MGDILKRAWREPAVAIGLIASIALAVITILTGDPWDAATIAGVAAPLVSALGIRQLVTPTASETPTTITPTNTTPNVDQVR